MKAVVAAFNQEKALVGAFAVITNLRMELFEALVGRPVWCKRELLCLEWLLQEAIGMKMTGYEVNRSWWEGAHSIPHFIDISELQNLQISESIKT